MYIGFVTFINNSPLNPFGNGSFESPYPNATSAIQAYYNRNDADNYMIITPDNVINDVTFKVVINNSLTIKSMSFINNSTFTASFIMTLQGTFEIHSQLKLINLIIRLENPQIIYSLFTIIQGGSLYIDVIYIDIYIYIYIS